ncbi:hypothetical protein JR316_0004101 [Psilocybe cubensis]|uniref:Uncharacterized protein n=1 Tax=Psilocybe cubensis TaxID=181762 RepID=A0ACB8HAB7_PSICU|nr:hypothetical protein JR316_0004101 [Psilocybe cubensis]KAH9484619.1 hypothetical protein JR316_0004101 [Psilocybe cubensis]
MESFINFDYASGLSPPNIPSKPAVFDSRINLTLHNLKNLTLSRPTPHELEQSDTDISKGKHNFTPYHKPRPARTAIVDETYYLPPSESYNEKILRLRLGISENVDISCAWPNGTTPWHRLSKPEAAMLAIWLTKDKRATISEIFEIIMHQYPALRKTKRHQGWQVGGSFTGIKMVI